MTEDRPAAIAAFLAAHGWGGARRSPLAGDASFRRYERLRDDGDRRRAVLMDAPPPENVRPFVRVAGLLRGWGYSAPRVLAADAERGLLLLEDLGDALFSRLLANRAADEEALYAAAVDLLVDLQRRPPPTDDPLPPYDDGRLLEEVERLILWYEPAAGLGDAAREAYGRLWLELFPLARVGPPCLVYVDYHADNLIWLPERAGHARVGLLDFQDARVGPPAYDLVSLLEDARRDVAPALAEAMVRRYLAARPELDPDALRAAYAILGAQRNAKILGLFSRLARRDGKRQYLALQPRVRGYLERDLAHPALDALRAWFREHLSIPPPCAPA